MLMQLHYPVRSRPRRLQIQPLPANTKNTKKPAAFAACGFRASRFGSGNLNGDRVAGVAELAVCSHVEHVGLEAGQLGIAVMGVGADDQAMTDRSLVRGSA